MKSLNISKRTQFAVLGLGKFGSSVASTLFSNGYDVMCCDLSEAQVHEAASFCTHAVQADVTDKAAMENIGLGNFDVVIVALSEDFENALIAVMIAKELGVPFIVAKANGPRQKVILESIGVDRVILPEVEMGERVALSLISNNLMEYIHLSDEYDILEMRPKPEWVGKSLQKLRLRQTESLNIIAIIRNNKVMAVLDPSTELMEQDLLIVLKQRT
ncbi:MAG TPA: TrkA family potassium uptake protein [Clostridiales bacterium]|jgi:trk system potassium uptake protein TrkA|nr:TrkA family potassium uptake protein [Clostridiales bacterium]